MLAGQAAVQDLKPVEVVATTPVTQQPEPQEQQAVVLATDAKETSEAEQLAEAKATEPTKELAAVSEQPPAAQESKAEAKVEETAAEVGGP